MSPAVGRSFLRLSLFHSHLYLVTKLIIADWIMQDVPVLQRYCLGDQSFDEFQINMLENDSLVDLGYSAYTIFYYTVFNVFM